MNKSKFYFTFFSLKSVGIMDLRVGVSGHRQIHAYAGRDVREKCRHEWRDGDRAAVEFQRHGLLRDLQVHNGQHLALQDRPVC